MATLITLRRRIKAARNVSKTTRAMQMIAASKLKKAQDAALASRPYVTKLSELTGELSSQIEKENLHPYMQERVGGKTLIIVLSPDKGLCGGLVTNLIREFLQLTTNEKEAKYVVIGKKLEGQVVKLSNEILATFPFGTTLPRFDAVYPIIEIINKYYLSGEVTSVKVLYTDFASIFSQVAKIVTLLPIVVHHEENEKKENRVRLFEPTIEEMLPELLKHYLEMTLFQYLLESFVSEQGSRMIAMQNATNNAKDIITDLRLEYNKTRQAKITSELLDISSSRRMSL